MVKSAQYVDVSPKQTAATRKGPGKEWWEKSSQGAEFKAQLPKALGWRSQVMANGLAAWSRGWREQDWKIGNKDIWGRGMWMELWEWAHSMCIFESHINAHQKACVPEEALNKTVDRMTHPVNASEPLSSATSVFTKELMNEWISRGSLTWWAPFHQGWSSYPHCRMPDHQGYRPMLNPWNGIIPQGHKLAFNGKFITLDLLYPGEKQIHPS